MKKDNFNTINEMRRMLSTTKKLVLENFIMPEEDTSVEDQEEASSDMSDEQSNNEVQQETEMSKYNDEVKQAIIQIRKISIGVIVKLADNPTSESYAFMKRILDMSDKAMESFNNNGQTK